MSRIKKGFTLVELLCTIVILLLVSAAVNVGIHLAVQNYASSITNSEAHVLCGTVGDLVCDELRFGSDYTWEEEGLIFTSRNIANRQQSYLTVSSAAQVFRDSVATGNCNYSRTVITVEGAADKEEEKGAMSGPFSQEIGDAVEALLGAHAATGYERDYLITVGSSAEEFEPMNLHLRLEKTDRVQDCLLTATFSNVLPQSTAAMVSGYTPPYAPTQMVLTLRGSLSHTEREYNTVDGNRAKKVEDVLEWTTDTMELSKPVAGEEDLP